jgi:dTDP-4-dehydrorhamnose reductase
MEILLNKLKKIFIAGSGGMLGDAFYKRFSKNFDLMCTDININEKWLTYLDFRNRDNYFELVEQFKPNYLFHLGAHTDLEYCEKNPHDAYNTNTISVETATQIANKHNIPLLYISTAGIFGGEKDFYDDWDHPNPLSHYGRSKYEAEKIVQQRCKEHLICRAGWMMGGGPKKDKKFINKLIKQIRAGAKELYIVNDKLGTPTYTHDFANTVNDLVNKDLWGLYNVVCSEITSRLEVAEELLNLLNLNNKVKIIPVNSDYWKETYFAKRPESERLITTKLDILKLNNMRGWKECLKEYLIEQYNEFL